MRALHLVLLLASMSVGGDDEFRKRASLLTGRLEKLLGPKFSKPVDARRVHVDVLVDRAKKSPRSEGWQYRARIWQRFNVAPKKLPRNRNFELMREYLGGLYDPTEKRVYVVRRVPLGSYSFDILLAHELVHAYRAVDKDYLASRSAARSSDHDYAMAITCMIEGDAKLIGDAVGRDVDMRSAAERGYKAPRWGRVVREDLEKDGYDRVLLEYRFTPYAVGHAFAAHLYKKGGLKALEQAYDHLPLSTEQILHPEKYTGPDIDRPTRIEGGDPVEALGDGWRTVHQDTLGEFDMRALFSRKLGEKRARIVGEGWDGIRYFICEKKGRSFLLGVTSVWDTPRDAREFADAWAAWCGKRDGGHGYGVRADAQGAYVATADGAVEIRIAGRRVMIADAVPPGRADAVLDAL
ncbi:MAG: hypothetical protein ACYTGZ_14520, partial [Planctomycetota bacterium]